jgi:hypothetical protein
MKKLVFTILFVTAFASSALFLNTFADSAFTAAPVANAGNNITVFVGEAIRLDGSASTGYVRESQTDGTWSIRWQTGDGFDAENIIKIPHVYQTAGVYTATLTVKDASGAAATSTIRVTAVDIPPASTSNTVLLTNTGNPETNRHNLQAAVKAAAAKSATGEVRVPAGFVFNDPLILPARTATNYVTIRVADLSTLPANVRVTGSAADKAKLFRMDMRGAPVTGYNNAVQMNLGAKYYRIIGMEIRHQRSEVNTDMIGNEYTSDWRTDNSHFIFDRCLLDGNGFETRKAAVLNGKTMSLINSSVLDIKARGVETKAVAQWEGAGPLAVVNNRLEAASINLLIGGASDPGAAGILDGLAFRGNHVWKNPNWQNSYLNIKNLFELKQGFNTIAAGNIFENNYQDGQSGEAILIKSMTDDGCASCEVSNVDFRNNKILNTRAGFNVVNMQAFNLPHPKYANHIRFANNFWNVMYGRGNLSQGADYFELTHNTFVSQDTIGYWIGYEPGSTGVPESYKAPGYKLLNNISPESLAYGIAMRCDHANELNAVRDHNLGADVRKNVLAGSYAGAAGNYNPPTIKDQYVDYNNKNYQLKAGSIYKNAGTDGKDIGADWTILNASTASATSGVWGSTVTPKPIATPKVTTDRLRPTPKRTP